jgi:hypothetical protein
VWEEQRGKLNEGDDSSCPLTGTKMF